MQHWINKCHNPTWKALSEALKVIGESKLAAAIAEKYGILGSITSDENSLVPASEYSSSRGDKGSALSKPSYFAVVFDKITEKLEKTVEPEKLLRFLRICPKIPNIDQHINSKVSEVMEYLYKKCINYKETELLEAILKRFECKEGQSLLHEYYDHYPNDIPDETHVQTRCKRSREKCDGHLDSGMDPAKKSRTSSEGDCYFDTHMERRAKQFSSKERNCLKGLLRSIPKSVLEKVCSDAFLWQLAIHMRDWTELATPFGISELGVKELARRYPDVKEQTYRALYSWKQIKPDTALYENLIACLLAHAPFDLAEAALNILTSGMHNFNSLVWND